MPGSSLTGRSDSGLRVSRLSGGTERRPPWAIAVFAHNESGRIANALEHIAAATGRRDVEVWVLANGCTDSTADEVRACAGRVPNLWLAELALGDKANAWNVFLHDLISPERATEIDTYFFTDGDVTVAPNALQLLADSLAKVPTAWAAGGMPATGRDRDAWRDRMARFGNLAGNLYALRAPFVDTLRLKQVRIPIGLIGEDFLVTWLAAGLGTSDAGETTSRIVFCPDAEFGFRSLSPWRPVDYRRYLRRKWRYAQRALQLEMLSNLVRASGAEAIPAHVDELYRAAPLPSRLRWAGRETPFRLLALLKMRHIQQAERR